MLGRRAASGGPSCALEQVFGFVRVGCVLQEAARLRVQVGALQLAWGAVGCGVEQGPCSPLRALDDKGVAAVCACIASDILCYI